MVLNFYAWWSIGFHLHQLSRDENLEVVWFLYNTSSVTDSPQPPPPPPPPPPLPHSISTTLSMAASPLKLLPRMPSNINWKERYLYIKVFIKLELWLSYFALHLSSKCGFSLSQSADFSFKNALPLLLIFLHTFPIVFHDVKFILIVASKKCATEPGTSDTSRSMPCSNNKAPTHSCVITQTNRA